MSNKSTKNSRRSFIQQVSFGSILLATGQWNRISAATLFDQKDKVMLRFVVASDSHYGQPNTEYQAMMDKVVDQINHFNQINPLDAVVVNGDIIHNDSKFLPQAKQRLDRLTMPWYVTRGNHDMVSAEFWNKTWGYPLNHQITVNGYPFLLMDSSNEKGEYLPPDLVWLKENLDGLKNQKQVFLFVHIPQAKWTKNAIDTPAFFTLLAKYPNIKAVFHGHEHDQDGMKMQGKIPFYFDAHIGGNWGTAYKGFRVVELMDNGSLATYMVNGDGAIQK
jgi:DNA repair exonuclease SbcCD nuclease subunit